MKPMWVRVVVLSVPLAIAACTAEREITRTITNTIIEEPRYCYRHFVGRDGIQCYATPVHRDERRLVGYTGPPPSHYPRPKAKPAAKLYAPAAVTYWVKDAELIPEPAPVPPGRRAAASHRRQSAKVPEKISVKASANRSANRSRGVSRLRSRLRKHRKS